MEITKENIVCPANNKLEISYPADLGPLQGVSFNCRISVKGSVSFEVMTSKAGGAKTLPDFELAEEASYRGARLLALKFVKAPSSGEEDLLVEGDKTRFVYVGEKFEFRTMVSGDAGLEQFERYLGWFRVKETDEGIVLEPRGPRISMETGSLFFWVRGVGPVDCVLDEDVAKPRARGRRSAAGKEMWTLDRSKPDVLVGGKTSTARVRPSHAAPAGPSYLNLVENLSVERV